jgi:ribonuclease H2 subunit B
MSKTLNREHSFSALNTYIQKLRDEAAAAAPPTKSKDTNKGKGADSGEGGSKKRKGAVKSSMGVEKLKKANTTGMAKMSSFFTKK